MQCLPLRPIRCFRRKLCDPYQLQTYISIAVVIMFYLDSSQVHVDFVVPPFGIQVFEFSITVGHRCNFCWADEEQYCPFQILFAKPISIEVSFPTIYPIISISRFGRDVDEIVRALYAFQTGDQTKKSYDCNVGYG